MLYVENNQFHGTLRKDHHCTTLEEAEKQFGCKKSYEKYLSVCEGILIMEILGVEWSKPKKHHLVFERWVDGVEKQEVRPIWSLLRLLGLNLVLRFFCFYNRRRRSIHWVFLGSGFIPVSLLPPSLPFLLFSEAINDLLRAGVLYSQKSCCRSNRSSS